MAAELTAERTLAQLVQSAADIHAGQVAIDDDGAIITYTELNRLRLRAAAAFHARGLRRGDHIAIWAPNSYRWIVAAIGAQTLGIVLVPINTRWKGSEAAYALNRGRATMLFTVDEFLGQCYPRMLADQDLPALRQTVLLQGQAPGSDSWDEFMAAGAGVDDAEVNALSAQVQPGDLMDIAFTSGTTGAPKGVMAGHGQNIRVYETWCDTVGLRGDDRYLIIAPFFHTFGYKAGWLACIIRGAGIYPAPSFDLEQVLAQIERCRITVLPGAPTIYHSLLAHPRLADYDISSLRLAVTGAAPVPVELVHKMRSVLKFETVVTAYGLTESCGTVSICEADDPPEVISATSGHAIAGTELRIVDPQGNELPRDEPGEIWLRGYNVMQGYLDDPQQTALTINSEGWLMTGDVGWMNSDGYIQITGRIKDMFIVGGFNCYPAEIENLLCGMEQVDQAAVIGVPDERMGEVACAWLVPAPGAVLDESAVISWCRRNMANYKVPRQVRVVDSLPTNAAGKVLKNQLRELAVSA